VENGLPICTKDSKDFGGADFKVLLSAVRKLNDFALINADELEPLHAKGLVHAHVRIQGTGAVLRIPRYSAAGLRPDLNILYQACCFSRASASGHTPFLIDTLGPCEGLPWGALIVSEVEGSVPRLPDDLLAISEALAAIHTLEVPTKTDCRPIPYYEDSLTNTLENIEGQAEYLKKAGITSRSRVQLEEELTRAREFVQKKRNKNVPMALVGTDTHPGNFMIQPDGTAIFVDLEKTAYGMPAIDLAHASVYTSTMWDPDIASELTDDDVREFYKHYLFELPDALRAAWSPWCGPLRRFTWLRTMTWCAKWQVESREGANWPVANNDPAYIKRVRRRIEGFFDADTIERVRSGFNLTMEIGHY